MSIVRKRFEVVGAVAGDVERKVQALVRDSNAYLAKAGKATRKSAARSGTLEPERVQKS